MKNKFLATLNYLNDKMENSNNTNDNVNIVQKFIKDTYDPHVEHNRNFIPRLHQILPKYYLLSGAVNSIILHYSLGSGKTAAAVFAIIQHIIMNKNEVFLNKLMRKDKQIKKVCVIGSWQTQVQFEEELMRPEFSIVNEVTYNNIINLLNSNDKAKHTEGVKKRDALCKNLNKYVAYYGYQKFFKLLFKFSSIKSIQNYKLLCEEIKHNRLQISQKFINLFSNSIIIVDEMQKLYSYNGLNTYGLTFAMLNSILKFYNIKVIYLTGTMFNTSVTEIEAISCLFSPELKYIMDDSKFITTNIIQGVNGKVIAPEHEQEYIQLLSSHFLYYEQNNYKQYNLHVKQLSIPKELEQYDYTSITPINLDMGALQNNVYIPDILYKENDGNELVCFALPYTKNLPMVLYIGNYIINDVDTEQPFVTFTLKLQGFQNDEYNKMLKKESLTDISDMFQQEEKVSKVEEIEENDENIDEPGDDDDDDAFRRFDESRFKRITTEIIEVSSLLTLAQYAFKQPYNKYGISHSSDGLYTAKLFTTPDLENYSKIAYTVMNLTFDLVKHNEKVVIHTSRITDFGVDQYIYMFCANGAVLYGDRPTSTSICKQCGETYGKHNKKDHEFKPIVISKLTGMQTNHERSHIINNAYNIANNITGNIISILIISDVAYSGISLFNTQNIILIAPISNISKWRQIYSRIVRTNSHDGLPFHKQYAKVYTFTVMSSDETIETAAANKAYQIKCVLNEDIEKFTYKLSHNSVNTTIIEDSFYNNLTVEAKNAMDLMFINDVQDELSLMFKRIFNNNYAIVWSPDALAEKLKDVANSVSYINFNYVTNEFLINNLIMSNVLTYDRSGNLVLTDYYKDIQGISDYEINPKHIDVQYSIELNGQKMQEINANHERDNEYIQLFKSIKQTRLKYVKFNELLTKVFVNRYNVLFAEPEILNYIFMLHDEFYDDDYTNFIHNHSSANRNIDKMTGFYCNGQIIKLTGESEVIVQQYVKDTRPLGKFLFIFKCMRNVTNNRFNLYLVISEVAKRKSSAESGDKRFISVGGNCENINHTILEPVLGNIINYSLSKIKICTQLLSKICDFQLQHPNTRYVVTPFENY